MANYDDLFTPVQAAGDKSYVPFDKEAWAARKQQEREQTYTMIDETVQKIAADGGLFKTYLDVQSRFDRYSVSNTLLITAQRPTATRLADFETWKENNSYVRKGQNAITILEPGEEYTREDGSIGVFYHTKKVFDISQTDAKRKAVQPVKHDARLLLKALINDAPCRITISAELPENVGALYQPEEKVILIRQGMEAGEIFRGLSQELAHARMDKGEYHREDCVFPAYCTSYVLCRRNGVDVSTYSFDRLPDSFKEAESKELRAELEKIRETANDISTDMEMVLEPRRKERGREDEAR